MCGRYAASASPDQLVEVMEVEDSRLDEPTRSVLKNPQDPPPGRPDHNVAPGKQMPVVLTRTPKDADGGRSGDPVRQLRLLTWGLVPPWAKEPSIGMRMINARAETLLEKNAYKKAALQRRCLVPADGWYEWQVSPTAVDQRGKPRKQPFFTRRADGDQLAFAGLYEFWRDGSADADDPAAWLVSYTIVTTAAEPGLDRIHERQPLVLDRDAWDRWLDPGMQDPDEVRGLLAAPEPGRFEAWPVSRAVGSMRNQGPELVRPVGAEELEGVVDPETGEVIGG